MNSWSFADEHIESLLGESNTDSHAPRFGREGCFGPLLTEIPERAFADIDSMTVEEADDCGMFDDREGNRRAKSMAAVGTVEFEVCPCSIRRFVFHWL